MLSTEEPNTLEHTFAIIKSDNNESIHQWIENQGFHITKSKVTSLQHEKWPSFKSDEVHVFILEKTNAINDWNNLIHLGNPGFISKENAYGSPTVEQAKQDIALVFNDAATTSSSEPTNTMTENSEDGPQIMDSSMKNDIPKEQEEDTTKEQIVVYNNNNNPISKERNQLGENSVNDSTDAEQLHENNTPISEANPQVIVLTEEETPIEKVPNEIASIKETSTEETSLEEATEEQPMKEELPKDEVSKEEMVPKITLKEDTSKEEDISKEEEEEEKASKKEEEKTKDPVSLEPIVTEEASIEEASKNNTTDDEKIHEQNAHQENVHEEKDAYIENVHEGNEAIQSASVESPSKEEPIKAASEQSENGTTEEQQVKTRSNELIVKPSQSRLRQPALRRGNSLVHSEKELTRTTNSTPKVLNGSTRIARLNASPKTSSFKEPATKKKVASVPRVATLTKKDVKKEGEPVKPKKKMSPDFISRLTAPTMASQRKKTAGEPSPRPARTTLPKKQQTETSKLKKKTKETVSKKTNGSAAGLATANPSGNVVEKNGHTEIKII